MPSGPLSRPLRLALYSCVLRWLPCSTFPGGRLWRTTREICVRPLLAEAGARLNIEHGAYFGRGDKVKIGDYSGIGVNCHLHGEVSIGRDVMMGPNVYIFAQNHEWRDPNKPMIGQGLGPVAPVKIGDDVWIGHGVTILPGVTIGSHAIIGAGSVVPRDVPKYKIYAGNPAREVGDRR